MNTNNPKGRNAIEISNALAYAKGVMRNVDCAVNEVSRKHGNVGRLNDELMLAVWSASDAFHSACNFHACASILDRVYALTLVEANLWYYTQAVCALLASLSPYALPVRDRSEFLFARERVFRELTEFSTIPFCFDGAGPLRADEEELPF